MIEHAVEFRRERFTAELLDPRHDFESTRAAVEVRWDPLTGQSCRLLPEGSLPPPAAQDLEALAEQSRSSCPFCVERVERETPYDFDNLAVLARTLTPSNTAGTRSPSPSTGASPATTSPP